MRRHPEDVLKEWMLSVNTGDLERLLALYSENAIPDPHVLQ